MNMRNLRVPDVPVVPIVFVALVAGLLVAAATPVAALPMSQEPRAPSRADRDIQGLMDAYIISKMEEALELDDEQFAKMVVAQRKLQQHRRELPTEETREFKGAPASRPRCGFRG